MISIKNVIKKYGGYKAVNNLNIDILDRSIVGLIGPNGAGKTSTINMMIGLTEITNGEIEIFGANINNNPNLVKSKIGYVSDNPNKFLKLKAIEYLNFVADMYNVSAMDRERNIISLAKRFNIYADLNTRMENFSKGMKQKIMIIASLIHQPKLWILDEPFTGLDPMSTYELKEFMKEYASRGNIILLSSHILEIVENLCDTLILIKSGDILYSGNIDNLKNKFGEKCSLENIYMEVFDSNGTSKVSKI